MYAYRLGACGRRTRDIMVISRRDSISENERAYLARVVHLSIVPLQNDASDRENLGLSLVTNVDDEIVAGGESNGLIRASIVDIVGLASERGLDSHIERCE